MSLETQTHGNFLFNVSTDQYAGLAKQAEMQAARKSGVSENSVKTTTVLKKETALSKVFGFEPEEIEVDGSDGIADIDMADWKGATAVTKIETKGGKQLGTMSSSASSGRSVSTSFDGGKSSAAGSSASKSSAGDSIAAVLGTTYANSVTQYHDIDTKSRLEDVMEMPAVFTAEEPANVFSAPVNDTPSFTSFVEAVASKLDGMDEFESTEFLADLKVAMPEFFQLVAANDDDGPSYGGRTINSYAQEAVTFAHEGLGVRRDVVDMRQSELQERFMKVMSAITEYEAEQHDHNDFGLDLAA